MKRTRTARPRKASTGDLRKEYRFDYGKARPNRFAGRMVAAPPLVVLIEPDVAEVFTTPASVNHALRSLIAAVPDATKRKEAGR